MEELITEAENGKIIEIPENASETLPVISQSEVPESEKSSKNSATAIMELIKKLPAEYQEEIKTRLSSESVNNSVDNGDIELKPIEEKPVELDINQLCDNTLAAIAAISRNDDLEDVEMEDLTEIVPTPNKTDMNVHEIMEIEDIEIDTISEEPEITREIEVINKQIIPSEARELSPKPIKRSITPEVTITKMEVDGKVKSGSADNDDDIIFIEDDEKNPLEEPFATSSSTAIISDLPDVSFILVNKECLKIVRPDEIQLVKEKVETMQKPANPPPLRKLNKVMKPGPKFSKRIIKTPPPSRVCINPNCTKASSVFCETPSFILNFYFVSKSKKKQSVCDTCFDRACNTVEEYTQAFVNNKPIMAVKALEKPDLVEIIDSDEEVNEEPSLDEKCEDVSPLNKKVIEALCEIDVAAMFDRFCEKFDIGQQFNISVDHCEKRIAENDEKLKDLEKVFKKIDSESNRMYNGLYAVNKYEVKELTALDLYHGLDNSHDPIHRIETVNARSDSKQTPRLRNAVSKGQTQQSNQPKSKQIVPIVSTYYAVRTKTFENWAPCRLLEKIFVSGSFVYKVQFITNKFNAQSIKTVNGKEIAYGTISEILDVGARVLAEFDRDPSSGLKDRLPGIIAEKLSNYNSRRYLVFCDDGRVQYIYHKHVHPIVENSENVWNDVHVNMRKTIKEFLDDHSSAHKPRQRFLLNVRRGHRIATEKNGQWKNATILDTDASIVKLQYVDDNTIEWIYRGSKRLGPVFSNSLPQKSGNSMAKRRMDVSMQLITIDDDEETTAETQTQSVKRSVAKKSTSKGQPAENSHVFPVSVPTNQQAGQNPKVKILNDDNIYVDDPARVARIRHFTPRTGISAQKYEHHVCNPNCAPKNMLNLGLYPPLSKPLLLSWERQINKLKSYRSIMYKAPCGRRLRNINEVHRYLNDTKFYRLNVDNFDFDMTIQVLANYEVEKSLCGLFIEDFSKGKEAMKIQVVNAFDDSAPNLQRYENSRTPTEGVNINTDKEFLCSCECTDDCLDKTKCACFLMTIEGAKYKNIMEQPENEISYVFKRLLHYVPTGIYECNKGCHCNNRCLNKVVQQPIQVKLQIYRTKNRGWGLQCLHDVAKGTFICIYAGMLYTEKTANSLCALSGIDHGDEYFAELDYIESTQALKDGYESDVAAVPEDDASLNSLNDDSDSDYDEIGVGDHIRKSTAGRGREIVTRSGMKPADANKPDGAARTSSEAADDSDSDEEPKDDAAANVMSAPPRPTEFKRFRKNFGPKERVYIMDAKTTGNVGRYFNHSCSPNLFVQSVFVDTHDVRFPWIAFFAQKPIKAGEELTWNYNYEVESVPNKVLYCKCGSRNCRGRIL